MTDKPSIPILVGVVLFAAWLTASLLVSRVDTESLAPIREGAYTLEREEYSLREMLAARQVSSSSTAKTLTSLRGTVGVLRSSAMGERLSVELLAYEGALDETELRIEECVTAQENVQGAYLAFSKSIGELTTSGLDSEAVSELASATTALLCSSLAENGTINVDLVTGLVGRIGWFSQRSDAAMAPQFEAASNTVLLVHKSSEDLEQAYSAVPIAVLRDVQGALLSAVDRQSRRIVEDEETTTQSALAVFSLVIGLLLVSFAGMRRLASNARAMKDELGQRVKDRTEQLVRMNQDLRDEMSERQKAELETRAAKTDAEVASQAKSEFLANMSHEIRTPMTAILGFSDRLLDPGLGDAGRTETVETIRRNGEFLLQIINDILDLSKIEAGKLQVERITCPLVDTVKSALDLLGPRASEKGLGVSIEYVGEVPQFIETDTIRLRQVLLNLVGNAIKFTRTGGVLLRVECVDEPYSMADRAGNQFTGVKPFMKFSVIDTGIGMSEGQLAALFSPFVQADNSTTRNFGGTGLGLSISKSLCGLLGGRIEVASATGEGSRFTFTLDPGRLQGIRFIAPASKNVIPVPNLPQRKLEPTSDGPCRVLLAEDGIDNQRLIRYLLERAGITVTIVGNGQQALNHAMAGLKDGDPFDVILMDMQMPVMDGYTAVRELRAAGYDRPIMALTAHAMQTDRVKCIEVGCDEFCPKPIDKRELIGLINQLTRTAAETGSVAAEPNWSDVDEVEMDDFDDDPEMLELINQFVNDLQADVVALKAAAERQDLEKITILAHQLKGCAGGYGFGEITDIAARVEKCAKSGDADGDLQQELEMLCTSCQALKRR